MNLTPSELSVYAYLLSGDDTFHPSAATISEAVNLSKRTVPKIIKALVDKNMIYYTAGGLKKDGGVHYSEYLARPISDWSFPVPVTNEARRAETQAVIDKVLPHLEVLLGKYSYKIEEVLGNVDKSIKEKALLVGYISEQYKDEVTDVPSPSQVEALDCIVGLIRTA